MDKEVFTDKAMIWQDETNKITEFTRYVVTDTFSCKAALLSRFGLRSEQWKN